MIGKVRDNHRILKLLRRGARGLVYEAVDVIMDMIVTLEMMTSFACARRDFSEAFALLTKDEMS